MTPGHETGLPNRLFLQAVSMVDFSLEQGSSFGLMFLVMAASLVLSGFFYVQTYGQLPRRKWQFLLLLRSLSIVLLVLLLFRPVYSYRKELTEKPGLIFLVDRSASMSIADDPSGVTRFDLACRQIERWQDRLRRDFDLRFVEFSENARPLRDGSELKNLRPDGNSTSIAQGLTVAARQMPRRNIEAVLLFSDGINNSARNPKEVADRAGVRVHTIGVGSGLRGNASFHDLRVSGINVPDRITLNNKARISASIESVGFPGRVVPVELLEDEKKIAEQELTLPQDDGSQSVTFEFQPTVLGKHSYTIKLPPLSEENIVENNSRSAIALCVEPGIRVLYLEGTLRAEYGALVDRFLAKDPDLQFHALVQTRPNVFLARTNRNDLLLKTIPQDQKTFDQFEVFLLGDLDSTYLRPELQEMLLHRIREGAGLLMLGGYHSLGPGGYGETPLGQALPVRLGNREIGQMTDPFLPRLTPDGMRHPIFANIAGFFPSSQGEPKIPGLPSLDGCTRIESARPGATVLATWSDGSNAMPVLAVQPFEKGRTAVFTGDTTRKWQQGPRAKDQESPYLRFWGQMVRWLAGRTDAFEPGANLSASLDKAFYEPEEAVRMMATVRNNEGQAVGGANVTVEIAGPSGKADRVPLVPEPGPPGRYSNIFDPPSPGTYVFSVSAVLGKETLKAEKLSAEVGRQNLEFERLDLDEKLLSGLASFTKGRYLHITSADLLLDQLDRSLRNRSEYHEGKLYDPPLFWILFVSLVSVEWFLRKRFQLR